MRAAPRAPPRFTLPVRRRLLLRSSMAPTVSSTIPSRVSRTWQAPCTRTMHLASVSHSTLLPPTSSEPSDMYKGGIRQGSESAFPKAEYDRRVALARKLLAAAGIDVMVVTGAENIFYITGQQTPGYYPFQALVLPVDGEPAFVIRQLEYFNFIANTFITNAEIYQDGDQPVNFLVSIIKARGWGSTRTAI